MMAGDLSLVAAAEEVNDLPEVVENRLSELERLYEQALLASGINRDAARLLMSRSGRKITSRRIELQMISAKELEKNVKWYQNLCSGIEHSNTALLPTYGDSNFRGYLIKRPKLTVGNLFEIEGDTLVSLFDGSPHCGKMRYQTAVTRGKKTSINIGDRCLTDISDIRKYLGGCGFDRRVVEAALSFRRSELLTPPIYYALEASRPMTPILLSEVPRRVIEKAKHDKTKYFLN